jgi:hypothetical protein
MGCTEPVFEWISFFGQHQFGLYHLHLVSPVKYNPLEFFPDIQVLKLRLSSMGDGDFVSTVRQLGEKRWSSG